MHLKLLLSAPVELAIAKDVGCTVEADKGDACAADAHVRANGINGLAHEGGLFDISIWHLVAKVSVIVHGHV